MAKPLHNPWVGLAALLGAGVVAVIGAVRDLDPDVVLLRAAGAVVGMGILAAAVRAGVSRFLRSE